MNELEITAGVSKLLWNRGHLSQVTANTLAPAIVGFVMGKLAASPVQGAASATCPDCKGTRGHEKELSSTSGTWVPCPTCCPAEGATSSASGAKDDNAEFARFVAWTERHNREAPGAVISPRDAWFAALADRSPAVQQVAGQARGLLRELVQAMRGYQMGADHEGPAPEKHRDMMRRAEEFLATPAPEQEAAQVEPVGYLLEWRGGTRSTLIRILPCKEELEEIGSDMVVTALGPIAAPVEQEAAQVAPPGAQEVHLFRWKFQATWQDIGKAAMVALMEGESASSYEFRTLYTAPVPATTPAEQPEGDSSHVLPPFAAPAGQHDATAPAKVEITREVGCFWHTNCVNHFGGIMRETKREADQSLFECLHCGKSGHYPVGGAGRVCSDEVASGSREGRDAQGESSGKGCATATNTNQPEGAAKADVPQGIYYSKVLDNFYCMLTEQGQGHDFYDKWRDRCAEFPQTNTSDFDLGNLGAANTNKGGDQ